MTPSIDVIRTVTHPLVRSIYMKKDYHLDRDADNILVIETNFEQQTNGNDTDNFDSYLVDLLIDLQDLKDQAEKEIGAVDRVDIRRH